MNYRFAGCCFQSAPVVLDKSIRTQFQIQKNDSVLMNMEQWFLCITSESSAGSGEKKNVTIGRFNFPESGAKGNGVHVGDIVYLVATDRRIDVCPKNIELLCIGPTFLYKASVPCSFSFSSVFNSSVRLSSNAAPSWFGRSSVLPYFIYFITLI
jgi:hypothetical protein